MTVSLPSGIFDIYHDVMNNVFLSHDGFSSICTVFYPPVREACVNCNTNHFGGQSSNVYQHGGPAPFNNIACVACGGNGYREREVTDTLRLRIYWSKKDWITNVNMVDNIVIPEADAQIIGKISDMPKILQAQNIKPVSQNKSIDQRYVLQGEPFLHGFGKSHYFVAYIKRC